MASLNWIGKQAVVNHDKEVPFRLLKKVKSASVGENSQNLIIQGDNLEALKALMPHYVGKIKCMYIDPPYNTGNENWVYNDNVNSPKIRKWIGEVVGGEDLTRHDKWLCMIYPRLKLLRDLLTEDGVIFMSADDNEQSAFHLLLKELFGEGNVEQMIWQKTDNTDGVLKITKRFRVEHEYVLVAYKNKDLCDFNKVLQYSQVKNEYGNPDNDRRGAWISVELGRSEKKSKKGSKNYYPITSPTGKVWERQWLFPQEEMTRLIDDGRVYFGKDGNAGPRFKKFVNEKRYKAATSILRDLGSARSAMRELDELFGKRIFNYPKPKELIMHFIGLVKDKEMVVLDSFAGSGTTGHAVMELNKEDNGNRKYILVEMEENIAKNITSERIRKSIKKFGYKAGFEYCELDKPLFNEYGHIEESCDFRQFATYIYFTETQSNIDQKKIDGSFIGEQNSTEYYLIYKEPKKNDLNKLFLKKLKKTDSKKVVYADRCTLDEDLMAEYNIVFKQIPYEVTVY